MTVDNFFGRLKVVKHYQRRRDELKELAAQEREDILERIDKPLRIGAMCERKGSRDGQKFFHGDVCHVAIYLWALPVDVVTAHYMAGVQLTSAVYDRLYTLAGAKFQAALALAPEDYEIVTRYTQSVVNYLELESMQARQRGISPGTPPVISREGWKPDLCYFVLLASIVSHA